MKRVIALISDCKEIQPVCNAIAERRRFYVKKIEDLEKQRDKAIEDMSKESKEDWEHLIDWLRMNGKLPDNYNEQTHNISFQVKENTISLEENSDECGCDDCGIKAIPIPKQLVELFKLITKKKKDEE